jgi:broad specificity phosphatase PhoE
LAAVTTLFVVRHARAGRRDRWDGPDEARPLSKAGRRQAEAVATRLESEPITRIVSSPYVRCLETVAPLAERLGCPVQSSEVLAEGTRIEEIREVLDKCGREVSVLCTHGDVIELILEEVRARGVKLKKPVRYTKGSIWELAVDNGTITRAKYHPAP